MMLYRCQLQLEVHFCNFPTLSLKNIKGLLKLTITPPLANISHGIVSRGTRSSNRVFRNVKIALGGKKGDVDMRSKVFDEGFEGGNSNPVGLLALYIETVRQRVL